MQLCENNTEISSKIKFSAATVLDILCIVLISLVSTITLVRDFPTRLCQIVSDENLAAHSHFYIHPEHFNLDVEFQSWSPIALSSMLNWLPASISKLTGIEPLVFFQIGVFFQNAGIAVGTYLLSRKLFENLTTTNCRTASLLSAIFVMFWRPQWYNASLICGLDWVPYANWVALPFLLVGLCFALDRKIYKCCLMLLLGVLIHPIMGGLASILTAIFYCFTSPPSARQKAIITSGLLLIVTAAVIQIPIYISTASLHFTADTQRRDILIHNIHATPWLNHYPYGIASFAAALICILNFSVLALLPNSKASPSKPGQTLIICAVAFPIAVSVLHCVAAIVGFNPVHNLILTRATVLLLLIAAPSVVAYFFQLLTGGPLWVTLPVLTCLFSFSPLSLTAATLVCAADKVKSIEKGRLFYWPALLLSLLLTTVILISLLPQTGHLIESQVFKPLLADFAPQLIAQSRSQFFDWRIYTVAVLLLLCAKALKSTGKLNEQIYRWAIAVSLVATLSYAGITENRKLGKADVTRNTTYCQTQLWARDNTPEGSSFILVQISDSLAWRGLTKRQIINISPIGQIYRATSIVEDYNEKLKRFWSTHKTINVNKTNSKDLSTEDWMEFAQKFGGDYLVRCSYWPKLNLPVVYSNRDFVIYKILKTDMSVRKI